MNRQQAMGKIAALVDGVKNNIEEAKKIADEYGLLFEINNEYFGTGERQVYRNGEWVDRWDNSGCTMYDSWDSSSC